jgi:hypothetical protein
MAVQEARSYVKKNNAKLQAAYDKAPIFDDGEPGKYIGRGFGALKEFTNKNSQPKVAEKQVTWQATPKDLRY